MSIAVYDNCEVFIDTDADDYEVSEGVNFICEQCGKRTKDINQED